MNVNEEVLRSIDEHWATFSGRLALVPGKELLSRFNARATALGGHSVAPIRLAQRARVHEIDEEVARVLRLVESSL